MGMRSNYLIYMMEPTEDNFENNPSCSQGQPLIAALMVDRSPSGKIKIISDKRVILKKSHSGHIYPVKVRDLEDISEAEMMRDEKKNDEPPNKKQKLQHIDNICQPTVADSVFPSNLAEALAVDSGSKDSDDEEAEMMTDEKKNDEPPNKKQKLQHIDDICQPTVADPVFPPNLAEALAVDSGSEESDDEDYSEDILRQILESEVEEEEETSPPAERSELSASCSWSADFETFTGVQETYNEQPGPTISSTDPFELFSTVWDRNIMECIVRETNEYAWQIISRLDEIDGIKPESRLKDWVEISVEELYKFFSIMIYMGLCHRGRIDEYWTTGVLEIPQFRKIMSKNRFILILRFLHFVNNDDLDLNLHGQQRKIYKIAPIIDHCNSKFREMYIPQQHLSLDESLLLWKGRLNWIQCIRSKAARFGIKTYELCEAVTGYLLKMVIYSGKNNSQPVQAVHGFTGATSKIVIQLMNDYFHKGHCLVMDNFYNSVALTRFLKEQQGTDVLGSLNRRRTDTPPDIKALVDRRMQRGEIVARHCKNITVLSWKDVKLVTMISTYHNSDTAPGQRAGQECIKPLVIHSYNKYMGGVDLKDQKLSMYLLERKRGLKWYVKVFRRLLNISVLNTFIIYRANSDSNSSRSRKLTHREYRYALAKSLSEQHLTRQRIRSGALSHPRETRLDGTEHFPEHEESDNRVQKGRVRYKRGRCARCLALTNKKRTESNVKCSKCRVYLCIGTCWRDYHTKEVLSK